MTKTHISPPQSCCQTYADVQWHFKFSLLSYTLSL
jgi:hypothetical protein